MKHLGLCLLLVLSACEGRLDSSAMAGDAAVADETSPVDCSAAPLPAQRLRRLSRRELALTTNALAAATVVSTEAYAPDVVVEGFETSSKTLVVNALLADQLQAVAETVGAAVALAPSRFGGCSTATDGCRDAFLRAFGAAAFRQPLDDAQLTEYRALYELARADGHGAAAGLVAEAMLTSPFFVYRAELGRPAGADTWALTDHELASQLSYFLTGGPPDAALLAAAAAGELHEPAQLAVHARRLLERPDGLGGFVDAWLELDRLDTLPKEPTDFTPTLRAAMREEAHRFFADVVTRGGSFEELLTARAGFVNAPLATFYGLPGPQGAGFERVDWPQGRRSGLLTLGAFLATHGKPSGSSPVHRGAVIRARLLCQKTPPPPPNVDATPPPEQPGRTTRERFSAHASNAGCAGCHALIDPLGFALEHFDGVGRERSLDEGLPIDASGALLATTPGGVTFDGARELSAAIAASTEGRGCFVTQVMRFGLGTSGATDPFTCVGATAARQMTPSTPLRDVVLSLVTSEGFRRRAGPTAGVAPMLPAPVDAGTSPTPVQPQPMPGLQVTRAAQSTWPTGFCDDVRVTNQGATAVDWAVELTVDGTITNAWNASASGASGTVRFTGVAWNARLEPMASASFGFCASKE